MKLNELSDTATSVIALGISFISAVCVFYPIGYHLGVRDGAESVTCPVCQECGYKLPGLELIDAVATKTDKETLKRIALQETRGRHYVVIEGAAGERGMMQVHPVHGDECYGIGDVSLPENNIKCGDLVFQNCLKKHKGNRMAALCCYNGAEIKNGSCEYTERINE